MNYQRNAGFFSAQRGAPKGLMPVFLPLFAVDILLWVRNVVHSCALWLVRLLCHQLGFEAALSHFLHLKEKIIYLLDSGLFLFVSFLDQKFMVLKQ